jgi:hypothetical protein
VLMEISELMAVRLAKVVPAAVVAAEEQLF